MKDKDRGKFQKLKFHHIPKSDPTSPAASASTREPPAHIDLSRVLSGRYGFVKNSFVENKTFKFESKTKQALLIRHTAVLHVHLLKI